MTIQLTGIPAPDLADKSRGSWSANSIPKSEISLSLSRLESLIEKKQNNCH